MGFSGKSLILFYGIKPTFTLQFKRANLINNANRELTYICSIQELFLQNIADGLM